MSDPAIEAAQRAADRGPYAGCCKAYASAAAVEALKPLRELHHRTEFGHCAEACVDMHGNTQEWPCDTAKLIYPESELYETVEGRPTE